MFWKDLLHVLDGYFLAGMWVKKLVAARIMIWAIATPYSTLLIPRFRGDRDLT